MLLLAQQGGLAEVEVVLWKCVDEGYPESTRILETLARNRQAHKVLMQYYQSKGDAPTVREHARRLTQDEASSRLLPSSKH